MAACKGRLLLMRGWLLNTSGPLRPQFIISLIRLQVSHHGARSLWPGSTPASACMSPPVAIKETPSWPHGSLPGNSVLPSVPPVHLINKFIISLSSTLTLPLSSVFKYASSTCRKPSFAVHPLASFFFLNVSALPYKSSFHNK